MPENPCCTNPVHDASGGHKRRGWFRQRHTCRECCIERIQALCCSRDKYETVKLVTREFRSYWCPFCMLEQDSMAAMHPKSLRPHCTLHAHLLAQKRCPAHNRRWTDCNQCDDPRAGSSFCLSCGMKRCACAASGKKQT